MSLTQQVVSSLKWTVGLRVLAQGVTWCSTFVVMRLLSPDDYGLMAMSAFVVALLALVAELGLGSALVQSAELDEAVLGQIFGVVLLSNAAIIATLWAVAPLLAIFFEDARMVPIIRAVSLQFVPAALSVVPGVLLKRRMDFRTLSLVEFTGAIFGSALTLALALAGAGVWTLVGGALGLAAWKAAGLNLMAPMRCRPAFSFSGIRRYMVFGGRVTTAGILWFLFTEIDIFLAGRFLGTTAVGYYSISKHIASLPLQRISQVLNQVIYPAFARIQNEPERAAEQLLRSVRLVGFVALPVIWGISCVSREIVLVILGPKWEPAIMPLQILSLVIPFRLIAGTTVTVAQSMGRADVVLMNSIVSSVVMPLALLVGCQFGLTGLSLVWVLVYPWVLRYNIQRSIEAVGLRGREVVRAMLPAVAAGLGMYAAVLATRELLPASLAGEAQLAILIAVGAASYAVLSLTFNREPVHEIAALVR